MVFYISHTHRKINIRIPETYLRPMDIDPVVATKVLTLLNALNTPYEISNTVAKFAGEGVLSTKLAQRILNVRKELGSFKDLRQVTAVPGIGVKKFNAIIYAFDELI